MDPAQNPETLERFKARLARSFFNPSVPSSQVELDRTVVDLVEDGLVVMQETERGFELRLTQKGEREV